MDNQHRKIKGYRELSQEEIDLVNEIKETGEMLKALVDKVTPDEIQLLNEHEAMRWRAIARTHFQEGLMALTRAVTKPEFF